MNKNRSLSALFFMFALCIFTLALGQFSTIYKFEQGSLYLFDFLITVFDIFGLIFLLKFKIKLHIPIPFIFLITFAVLGIVSLIFTPSTLNYTEFFISASYATRLVSYIFFGIIICNLMAARILSGDMVLYAVICSGLFLFAAGLVQLVLLPDLEVLDVALGWDPHKNRMASTFFDPNFLGVYFVLCLAAIFEQKRILKSLSPIVYFSILTFILGIFFTFSRSAWLAASVYLFFVGLKNKAILIASVSVVLLAIFVVPRVQTRISGITDPQDSAGFRLLSWRNSWEIIKDNWVFGTGYNTFRYVQKDYGFLDDSNVSIRSGSGSDSSLLLVWATSGIFGLVFFTGFFIVCLVKSVRRLDLTSVGLIFALLVDSIFINSLFYPQIIIGTFILVAVNQPNSRAIINP